MYDYRDTVAIRLVPTMLHGTYVIDIICNYLYFVFVSEYYYLDIYYDIKCYTCTENFCESVAWQMRTMSTNYL